MLISLETLCGLGGCFAGFGEGIGDVGVSSFLSLRCLPSPLPPIVIMTLLSHERGYVYNVGYRTALDDTPPPVNDFVQIFLTAVFSQKTLEAMELYNLIPQEIDG